MKTKTHHRQNHRIAPLTNLRYFGTPVMLGLFLIQTASAAITTWTGAGGDDNWATLGNWDVALAIDSDVVFAALDATGTTGPSGTANNIVNANTTISTLKYTTLATTGYHTTQIPAGVTLTVVGGDAVSTTSAKPTLFVSSPTTASTDVVYATLLGDGNLVLNNAGANMHVGQGTVSTTGDPDNVASTTRRATLDMAGLNQFQANLGRIIVGQQTVVGNRANGTILLAKTNIISLNNATLPGITLGDIGSNNGNSQIIELGINNSILTNTGITVGGRKGNGIIRFNSAMVGEGDRSAVFRDLGGTGRQANWLIGDNSGQSGGGTNSTGVVDFSLHGEVDALVGNIILGRATVGTASTSAYTQGTLTFDSGTIDANSLTAGIQPTATKPGNARGTVNVDGTGKLLVNGNVTLGRDIGEATYSSQGLINIGTLSEGGAVTIAGDVICGTGVGNKITLADGSLTLGGKVGDDSVAGDAPLETLQLDGGLLTFNFGTAPNPAGSRVKVANLNVPNSVSLGFKGTGLSSALPDIELIKYTTFDHAAQFANLSLVGLPLRVEAQLVNNTANKSVDLKIISVSSNKWAGEVSGVPNGNWDIDTTVNWKLAPANTPSTYLQAGIPGEPVTFDNTATGTKTVNLTTTLSPGSITVDSTDTYTFNGTGTISGPTGITKRGAGPLVIGNSGTNDFTGGINIEAGKIQIGSSDRLPVNATVTLSDVATAELNLNNFNQTLLSLNGGGVTGGDVQLGTGTLTLTGAGNYAGAIEGTGSLVKSGTGNQVLSGASTVSGGTTITGGRITVANSAGSGLGTGPVVIGVGGELSLGDGTDTGNIAATTVANDGLLIVNRSDDTTFDKTLIGTGGLTKNGAGTLLIDAAKTHGGLTTVSGGALRVTHPQALGTATDAAVDGTIINNPPAVRLELSGGITLAEPIQLAQKQSTALDAPCLVNVGGNNTLTGPINLAGGGSNWNIWSDAGKLTIAGTATNTNTTNTRNLRFYGAGAGEISSNLANGAGTSLTAVFMIGSGTWKLSGTNTYTGNTTVESGTLLIDGIHTTSTVTVNSGGKLGGTGTLGTVNATGTITPGDGIEPLTAAAVTLSGTLAIEVAGAAASQLTVSGALDLTGATVTVSGTPTAGTTYTVASAGTLIGAAELTAPSGYELMVDGNLLKLKSTSTDTPFTTWATLKNLAGNDALPGADPENDGLNNAMEFVLGGDPKANDNPSIRPQITTGASSITLTFKRSDASELQPVAVRVQVSTDLATWNLADTITIGATNGSGPNEATYTVDETGTEDTIVVTIPMKSATRKFVRVEAVMP